MVRAKALKSGLVTLAATVMLLLIASVLVVPRLRRFAEPFEVMTERRTSQDIYQDATTTCPNEVDVRLRQYEDLMGDKDYSLLMQRCYQFPNKNLENINNDSSVVLGGSLMRKFNMFTVDFNEVVQRITRDVDEFKQASNGKVYGPVYALIFQAPYYRNSAGGVLSIQSFNVDGMQYAPRYDERDPGSKQPVFYFVMVIYDRYNTNRTLKAHTDIACFKNNGIPEMDKKYFSKELQCYIKGVGSSDGINKFVGCASTNGSTAGAAGYAAKCLGPASATAASSTDPKNTESSYGILYMVNSSSITDVPVPASTNKCATYNDASVGVSFDCIQQTWKDVGCPNSDFAKPCGWWSKQNLQTVKDDMRLWATMTDDTHRAGCFGTLSTYEGKIIRDPTTSAIYKVEDGKLRYITNTAAYRRLNQTYIDIPYKKMFTAPRGTNIDA